MGDKGLALGHRLRAVREARGWSLRGVAARAGVNHGYLSQLERGEVSQPAPSTLHKLSGAYGESFVVLMRWAGYVEADESGLSTNQARALSYLGDDVSDDELEAIKVVLEAIRSKRSTFSQHAQSLDGELSRSDREDIRALVLKLLDRADSVGHVPTPLPRVMEVSKLVAAGDISLEEDERRQLRKRFGSLVDRVLQKLQGVIHFRSREVWVLPDLHELKKRFVSAHEIGHDMLPWQHDVIAYLDNREHLRPDVRIAFERQANQAAIELLAQGDALRAEADDSRLTVELLSSLSAKYQISMQAASRRVVEETRQQVALAIRFRGSSRRFGPYHIYCSDSFQARFGWRIASIPPKAKTAAREALAQSGTSVCNVVDRGGSFIDLEVESILTPYALIVLFLPSRRRLRIRRA